MTKWMMTAEAETTMVFQRCQGQGEEEVRQRLSERLESQARKRNENREVHDRVGVAGRRDQHASSACRTERCRVFS